MMHFNVKMAHKWRFFTEMKYRTGLSTLTVVLRATRSEGRACTVKTRKETAAAARA
jgi:hypothetical protein